MLESDLTPLSEALHVLSDEWFEFLARNSDPSRVSHKFTFSYEPAEENESPFNSDLPENIKLSLLILLKCLVQESI